MTLDPDACYRALESRDPRFDGRFFIGVLTTGVYCRPICPARTPRRRNVRFFPSAAAAAEAGFRPCRRCRPEASPGSPAWRGSSAAASRALRLVAEGALDGAGVADLAGRVGLGERQLRRLFQHHVGASPVAVAQTRRVHFAKKLLDETDLPVTEVALAAGFASIRRFNTAMRAAYRAAPRELRRSSRAAGAPEPELVLRLAYRPPLAFDALLGFLAARAIPGVEEVRGSAYRRSVVWNGEAGVVAVERGRDERHLLLRAPAALARGLAFLAARARRLFDLDADPAAIASHLARDPALARRLRRLPGLRVPGAWDGFELAVRAILGQQITVAGATALAGRLVERWGRPLARGDGSLGALFPAAADLAAADLEGVGLPGARARAIRALAAAVRDGELELDAPGDPARAATRLEALPGVGPWTVGYVALRALGEPDAFPHGDLGLRRSLAGSGDPLSPRELEARAEPWRPWRGYAAMALWLASD